MLLTKTRFGGSQHEENERLSRRNFWLILVVTAIMLTAFPFLVRPFSQQSNNNPSSPQPFTFFILPETSTFSEPVIPILVAVILPSELSQNYQLSDFFVVSSEGLLVPTFPLLEEPFFDSETNSLVWLFAGLFDSSEILQPSFPTNLTLSAHSFFEPLEPSLSPLSSFDQISVAISLPQTERSQEGAKGREGTDSETEKKPSGEEQKVSGREVESEGTGEGSSAREVSGSKVKSAKEAVLRDPKVARKDFEQKIADKAISNAKKNPRSVGKGDGMVIIVGAYPEVLPADGKSTAFIVAKVTDEKGKPIAGREIRFSSDGGKILVLRAKTDSQGIAFSRICSEKLPKGQKKIVRIKAKTNPEGETSVLMDGSLSPSSTPDVPVSLKVWWQPTPSSSWIGVSDGEVAGAAAITFEAQPQYPYIVWCNYIIYEEQGNHPRLLKNGTDEPIYDSYFGNRWTWVPFEVGWSILHRSPIKVLASYTVAQDCPADPDMGWGCPPPVTETKEITVNAVNAVVKILEPEPPFLIWDPEDPSKNRLTVTFSVTTAQNWYAEVELRVYRLDRASNEKPIRVIREIKGVPGTHPISWDGMIEGEMGLEPAERGIYAFDLWVNLPQTPKPLGDSDTRCSPFMTILRWKDEKGGEVHEAEYYGYDDKGTEEESETSISFWFVMV
jgi:hypothetical protein